MKTYETENKAADFIKTESFIEAYDLLYPLIASDSEYALTTLAWMHEYDLIPESDRNLAISLYRRAAQCGSQISKFRLAHMLRDDGNFVDARAFFEEGALAGHLASMCWFGTMLYYGEGGIIDRQDGIRWWKKAQLGGHLRSNRNLLQLEIKQETSIMKRTILKIQFLFIGLRSAYIATNDKYSERVLE